jgi:hypothetical protein
MVFLAFSPFLIAHQGIYHRKEINKLMILIKLSLIFKKLNFTTRKNLI